MRAQTGVPCTLGKRELDGGKKKNAVMRVPNEEGKNIYMYFPTMDARGDKLSQDQQVHKLALPVPRGKASRNNGGKGTCPIFC